MALIGLPELVIIAVIALLIAGFGRRSRPHGEVAAAAGYPGAMAFPSAGWQAAAADTRYRHGVSAGNLAELLGLGGDRLQWRQIAVIVVGLSVGVNLFLLTRPEVLDAMTPAYLLRLLAPAVVFVVSAVVVVRSFRSGLPVSLATGLLYAGGMTALRWVLAQPSANYGIVAAWTPTVGSFVWGALTMGALAFASARKSPWIRLLIALLAASVLESFVQLGLYSGTWAPERLVESTISQWPYTVGSCVIMTAAFWIGYRMRVPG